MSLCRTIRTALLAAIVGMGSFAAAQPAAMVYNPAANAEQQIADAVRQAQRDKKQVLLQFGGNWCPWCLKLDREFKTNKQLGQLLSKNYEVVLVDASANRKLVEQYRNPRAPVVFPLLVVLDGQGRIVTQKDPTEYERGTRYDTAGLAGFLTEWNASRPDVRELVTTALIKATKNKKKLLVSIAGSDDAEASALEGWLDRQTKLLAKDYELLTLTPQQLRGGRQLADAIRTEKAPKRPWLGVFDASGKLLAGSEHDGKSVGMPRSAQEIAHLMKMVRETHQSLSKEELLEIENSLRPQGTKRVKREITLPDEDD